VLNFTTGYSIKFADDSRPRHLHFEFASTNPDIEDTNLRLLHVK